MKLAWIVRRFEEDDERIVFEEPGWCYSKRMIVYAEVQA